MRQQSVFITDDGMTFETEAEANAYENSLANRDALIQWIKDTYTDEETKERAVKTIITRTINIINKWEASRDGVLNQVAPLAAVG